MTRASRPETDTPDAPSAPDSDAPDAPETDDAAVEPGKPIGATPKQDPYQVLEQATAAQQAAAVQARETAAAQKAATQDTGQVTDALAENPEA